MATKTALVGQIHMDSKQAQAALAAVQAKMAAMTRQATTPISLTYRRAPGTPPPLPPSAYPTSAIAALNQQASRLVNVNGQVVRSNQAVNAGLQQTGRSGHAAGAGILETSRAFEDAQYGMRGVLNNIPGIIQSFGGGPGLAGVVSILAVSLSVAMPLFSKFTEAGENLKKANLEAAASYRQLLKDMEETAEKRGATVGTFEAGKTDRENAGRTNYEQIVAREERLLALKDKMKEAEMNRLEGVEKLRAEEELRYEAEMRNARAALDIAQRVKATDDAELPKAREAYDLIKAESEELDKQMKSRERSWKLRKEAEEKENKRLPDDRYRTHEYDGEYNPDPRDVERRGYLHGVLPGLKDRRDSLENRSGKSFNKVEDLNQQIQKELPGEHAAKLLEIKIQEEKEAFEETTDGIVDFLESFVDGAEEAGKAAAAIIKQKAKREEEIKSASKAMVSLFDAVGQTFVDVAEAIRKQRQQIAQKSANQALTERNLAISEIRNPRARRRAQRAASIKDRTNELMEKEGISMEEAAGRAAREQKVADRDSGDRTISGVNSAGPSGLDSFDFRQTKDRPIPEKKTDNEKRGRRALDKANETLNKSGGGTIGSLESKLDVLIQVTRDLKAPGESGKPLRSN